MCLDTLHKRLRKGRGVGYKVFISDDSYHLNFIYCGGRIKYNCWYKDKAEGNILMVGKVSYPTGYHVFLFLSDARAWANFDQQVRKVEYHNVVASGQQRGYPIVVVREMYIHKGIV